MGYVGWSGRIANEDATLVALARQAGAIPICKTNVPSTLMSGHTDNALVRLLHCHRPAMLTMASVWSHLEPD